MYYHLQYAYGLCLCLSTTIFLLFPLTTKLPAYFRANQGTCLLILMSIYASSIDPSSQSVTAISPFHLCLINLLSFRPILAHHDLHQDLVEHVELKNWFPVAARLAQEDSATSHLWCLWISKVGSSMCSGLPKFLSQRIRISELKGAGVPFGVDSNYCMLPRFD